MKICFIGILLFFFFYKANFHAYGIIPNDIPWRKLTTKSKLLARHSQRGNIFILKKRINNSKKEIQLIHNK